jgi:hypothetical protein
MVHTIIVDALLYSDPCSTRYKYRGICWMNFQAEIQNNSMIIYFLKPTDAVGFSTYHLDCIPYYMLHIFCLSWPFSRFWHACHGRPIGMMRKVLSNLIGHNWIFLAQWGIYLLQLKYTSFELFMCPLVLVVWIVRDYMVLRIHLYDDTNHIFNMLAQL